MTCTRNYKFSIFIAQLWLVQRLSLLLKCITEMKIIGLLLFLTFSLQVNSKNAKLNTGIWHLALQLNDSTVLPVSFLLKKNQKTFRLYLQNAQESIELKEIVYKNDSLIITFPTFDSQLKAKIIANDKIEGSWFNYTKVPNYKISFIAISGQKPRFPAQASTLNVNGKWEVTFDYDNEPEKAIGLFDQLHSSCCESSACIKNEIRGTFLTETGDYRYLEGNISNDSLYLSTFDGSHAFLFRSKLINDTLWGDFLSGKHYSAKWYAVRNEDVQLTDPDSLTYLINNQSIKLSLPDLNNGTYTYPNTSTQGKVTLIQIMGTWCPNCLDESRYLREQKNKYAEKLEIVAVTFETQETLEEKVEKVKRYKDNLELNYTFVIGGKGCKSCAAELFPMLNGVISFPTLIFIDKKGNIRRIHTGFNGPGTGVYYTKFVEKTNMFIEQLISE